MAAAQEQARFQKVIKELQTQADNKQCVTCNQRGPMYIVTNFSIFVCTYCSGIFRKYNFRVKGIAMSNFTKEEIQQLQTGGNKVCKETLLHRFNQDPPQPGDERRIELFVKLGFVQKQFQKKDDALPPTEPLQKLVGNNIPPITVGPPQVAVAPQPAPQPALLDFSPTPVAQRESATSWDPFGSPPTAGPSSPSLLGPSDPAPVAPSGAVNLSAPLAQTSNPFSAFSSSAQVPQPAPAPAPKPSDPFALFGTTSTASPSPPQQDLTGLFATTSQPASNTGLYVPATHAPQSSVPTAAFQNLSLHSPQAADLQKQQEELRRQQEELRKQQEAFLRQQQMFQAQQTQAHAAYPPNPYYYQGYPPPQYGAPGIPPAYGSYPTAPMAPVPQSNPQSKPPASPDPFAGLL